MSLAITAPNAKVLRPHDDDNLTSPVPKQTKVLNFSITLTYKQPTNYEVGNGIADQEGGSFLVTRAVVMFGVSNLSPSTHREQVWLCEYSDSKAIAMNPAFPPTHACACCIQAIHPRRGYVNPTKPLLVPGVALYHFRI